MKIGFFLANRGVSQTDFSKPWEGNPGTGAAEYLHVALPYFIGQYGGLSEPVHIFAPYIKKLPDNVIVHQADTVNEAAIRAKAVGIDYFVFRPRMYEENNILDQLDDLKLSAIGRAALTPTPGHIRRMARSTAFEALVCVGREQYDYLMDTPLYKKLAYIDNGVHVESCENELVTQKDPRLVVYMGALVPQKGFHVLAQAWPKVLNLVPDARLAVIGSAKMYNENSKLGPLKVAEEEYERSQLIPFLTNDDGSLFPSVTFHGRLGKEKYDILRRAQVGVANPTGQTETCCVSAVEMAACKTAVVSGAYYALLDTVHHNKTGLLGRGVDDLAINISKLLKDPERAIVMGEAGHRRVEMQYDFSIVAPKWIDLCEQLERNEIPKPIGRSKNIFRHFKFLRIANRHFQKFFGKFILWPSTQEVERFMRRILRG